MDEVDPVAMMLSSHLQTMQEIGTASLVKTQEICDHATSEFRKFSGLRSAALEKLLTAANIIPGEKDESGTS